MSATDLGKTRARDIGSGKPPKESVSVTATVVATSAPAALSASNPSAPAAFSAPGTGASKQVTTTNAADLTTVADALEVLRDEVALYEVQISALIADADAARTEQLTYQTAIAALLADVAALRTELVAMNIVAA